MAKSFHLRTIMQILIVEDDQELQAQLSRQLSNNGFQVQLANDGAQGLYFATEFPST